MLSVALFDWFSSNFSDRGYRRPPRSRRLDSGCLRKRNTAGQAVPTRFSRHTQPGFHDREHLTIPIGLEEVFTIEIWNPCSPSFRFRTPVHDQLELLSRWLGIRTLRFRVAFDRQFLHPLESGAQTRTHHSAVSPQNGKVCQRSSRRRREP